MVCPWFFHTEMLFCEQSSKFCDISHWGRVYLQARQPLGDSVRQKVMLGMRCSFVTQNVMKSWPQGSLFITALSRAFASTTDILKFYKTLKSFCFLSVFVFVTAHATYCADVPLLWFVPVSQCKRHSVKAAINNVCGLLHDSHVVALVAFHGHPGSVN